MRALNNTFKSLLELTPSIHQVLSSAGKMDAISQMPVVLLPIHFDRLGILQSKRLILEREIIIAGLNWNVCPLAADLLSSDHSG